jgi:ribonuclease HI
LAWSALEVAGDSNLIIRQLRGYVPPKNQRLLRLYADARRLADQVGVRRWTHQVRAYNKMADSLANHAMNQVASSQAVHPTARDGHIDIHVHLHNDIRPWLSDSVGSQVDFSFLS